jgi:hypothetical protein
MPDDQFTNKPLPAGGGRAERQPVAGQLPGGPDLSGADSIQELKHSELGKIACSLGVFAQLLFFSCIAVAYLIQQGYAPARDALFATVTMIEVMGFAALVLGLMGTILAIVGLVMGNRKKQYAWLGLATCLLPLLACGGISCAALTIRIPFH